MRSEATMKLLLILVLLPCIISGLNLTCPDIAEVNTAATLRCSFQGPATIYYDSLHGPDVAKCFENSSLACNSSNNRYSIARVNTNTINLNITSVEISDEGKWTCRNANTAANSTCPLVLRRTPSCDISSSIENPQQIDDDVEITLSVNITNHYCSVSTTFLLQVGNTRHTLKKVDGDIYNITFNVTTSHFGSLELLFICNNVTRNVPCGGVTSLKAASTEKDTRPPVSLNADVPNNKVVIIAGSIAAVVIIIVIIIVLIIVWKLRHSPTKRKSQESDNNRSTKVDNAGNEIPTNTHSGSNGIYAVSNVQKSEYDIPWDKKSWSLQKLLSPSDQTQQDVVVSKGNI